MTKERITVLLADDDRGFLVSLRELIDRQPELEVVGSAPDGEAAITLAGPITPDAAVLDLHVPHADGVAAIARLRRDHPSLCLIALTGDDDPSVHRAARQAGADAVISKGELVGLLLDRLRRRRAA